MKIKTALISVSDKSNLKPILNVLKKIKEYGESINEETRKKDR